MTPDTNLKEAVSSGREGVSYSVSSPADVVGAPGSDGSTERLCEVCGRALRGRQIKACSGKCRITACRARRHDVLLDRLLVAEEALARAHEAIAVLREIAALGPHATSTLGTSR